MLLLIVLLVNSLFTAAAGANLRCYQCGDSSMPYNCDIVETCSGADEACYIESLIVGGRKTYTQGCISSNACKNPPGNNEIIGRALHRRQEEITELQCCFANQCNKNLMTDGLVFRITPHIGGDVAQAWVNGTKTVSEESCRNVQTLGCAVHYRNSAIDDWQHQNITVVKYALYKDGKEVAYIYFNGTGSTMMNWFSQDRIINSTWQDIKTTPMNAFGIDVGFPPNRRFYINKDWGGCDNDHGWTVVISGTHVCNFDHMNIPYPYILYSKGSTIGHYDEAYQFGEADVAAVFIYHN